MVKGSVIAGRGDKSWIVRDGPTILKVISSGPGVAFARVIASRSEELPASSTFKTWKIAWGAEGVTVMALGPRRKITRSFKLSAFKRRGKAATGSASISN